MRTPPAARPSPNACIESSLNYQQQSEQRDLKEMTWFNRKHQLGWFGLLKDAPTVLGEGELQQGRDEEGQAALGVIDLPAALTEPARFSLIGDLIQTAVFPRHEDAAHVRGGDGQQVGVIRGDGVERIWQQLHGSWHAVIQTCGTQTDWEPIQRVQITSKSHPNMTLTCMSFWEAQAQDHDIHRSGQH